VKSYEARLNALVSNQSHLKQRASLFDNISVMEAKNEIDLKAIKHTSELREGRT